MKTITGAIVLMLSTATGAFAGEENVRIVTLEPSLLQTAQSSIVTDEPSMIVDAGKGATAGGVDFFTSKDGRFSAGLSKYDKLTLRLKDWPVDEFMHILEGQVEITDAAGNKRTFGPGDSFVMPKGFAGTWRQLGPIRKIQVSYKPGNGQVVHD